MRNEKDLFQCYVAENDSNEIVGMAVFFFAYYVWIGKSLYLDALYVKESYRHKKIGSQLLNKIFELAKNESCKMVSCQVSNWNSTAIALYKKCGVSIDIKSSICEFDETSIQEFQPLSE